MKRFEGNCGVGMHGFDATVAVRGKFYRQRWSIAEVIALLWARESVQVLLFGTRTNGIMRPADRGEIAKALATVGARMKAGEEYPHWTHSVVSAMCKQILRHAEPMLFASNVTTLVALAKSEKLTDVPKPKHMLADPVRHRPSLRLDRVSKIQMSMAKRRKVVLA